MTASSSSNSCKLCSIVKKIPLLEKIIEVELEKFQDWEYG
jgi:hypothetical protein